MQVKLYVFAYDSPSDKRRRRLRKLLLTMGDAVQYSVVEALLTVKDRDLLINKATDLIDLEADCLACYPIASAGAQVLGLHPSEPLEREAPWVF